MRIVLHPHPHPPPHAGHHHHEVGRASVSDGLAGNYLSKRT
jgi:hypothetical protein